MPGKGLATKSGEKGKAETELALIGLSGSDTVSGTGGSFKGWTAEAHGLESLGKIISVSYAAVEA